MKLNIFLKAFPPECCQRTQLREKPNSELLQAKGSSWGEHIFSICILTINFHFNSSEYHQLLPPSNPNWLTNLQNQNKVTGNKKGKKGEFEDAAKYMLTVHRDDLFYFFILLYIGYNMNLHFKSESPNTKPILIPDTQTHLIQLKQILSLIGKFRITCTFLGYLKTMRVVQPHWISQHKKQCF